MPPFDKIKSLKRLTENKVELAVNLIEYDEKFAPAMKNIFGNTFVAEDNETAKIIALENKIYNSNCVTLDGDFYRADGILTGGSV